MTALPQADGEAAARAAYLQAGLAAGDRLPMTWSGRVCHAHQLAFPGPEAMGPHFSRAHRDEGVPYWASPAEAA